jgi:hypothetical protein
MYLYACAALWVLALGLNMRDQRALLLAFVVGVSVFVPVPSDTALHFYSFCVSAEILVGLFAYRTRSSAGYLIANVCALLVITHVFGYVLNGSTPFSPYRAIVKILEVMQLLACVVLSPVAAPILRNRHALPT